MKPKTYIDSRDRERKVVSSFSSVRDARIWAYRELDTRQSSFFLVSEETIQGYTEYYFLNIDEYDRHKALWENDLDIIEVWE